MIWQDLVFMLGSAFSVFVLMPTLRNAAANVPLGTSLPSAVIGLVYGTTFATLGMQLSALGAFTAGTMWSIIALLRSPHPFEGQVSALARAVRGFVPTRRNETASNSGATSDDFDGQFAD